MKLMAPSGANFQDVYAAGEKIANWPLAERIVAGHAALAQWGTYDYQRDKTTNTFFDEYADASNYAVGVFMAGASFPRAVAIMISQTYAFFESNQTEENKQQQVFWTIRGWDDGNRGRWQ
ncbi:MAG: hypothetical protein ACREDT_06235 [Methylocella sp.]